ncbi:MAG: hypothetical protein R2809_11100 [Flavobacteriales bacterium]
MLIISETDQQWVEDNFIWLIKVFGYPSPESDQILLQNTIFRIPLKLKKFQLKMSLQTCVHFLKCNGADIFEVVSDIRDTYGIPYEIQGKPFETVLEK